MDDKIDIGRLIPSLPAQITAKYTIKKELGKGAYGVVYLAENKETKEQVALKRIINVFRTKTDAKRTLREISILRQCHHPNIVALKELPVPKDQHTYRSLWVVQEYGGADLSKVVNSSDRGADWDERSVKHILYQLLCGLLYLQSGNLVHRDLKPSNVLLNENMEVKIIDFGLARQMNLQYKEKKESKAPHLSSLHSQMDVETAGIQKPAEKPAMERQLTQHVVTRWYRAPELILLQEYYNAAIDVWSVGCIFAELLQTLEPGLKPAPLFPGKTCFPLSARRSEREINTKLDEEFHAETHQLMKIFEVIGTPEREDVEGLDEGPMKEFLLDVEKIPPADFSFLFPSASEEAIALLKRMLVFSPKHRITVKEAIASPFLEEVRDVEKEVVMDRMLSFPFEFDSGNYEMQLLHLRRLIYEETVDFSRQIERRASYRNRSATMGDLPQVTVVKKKKPKAKVRRKEKRCSIV
ncbi:mitogen-activated protein kinase [Blastocystis sp. ATCC 50177/Nand II]|uniref:Mitogen-activated protein kinase n=1 Tax=Blastocystis sp. subtype 1 (strain ATCC 50177 / NandII) TaxID=478820 RepID=A0A196SPF1_BLAHN|nr:mitogen-activated protein kinase [Blastocystis sp. ATCC 50177/Nand II]